ncbi:sensor histidine kinase [Nocardioides hwasunensis]|uniref:histidine kinase n=1 Tax=Nocardioides hwasunensis TaxID=397258 RepID=A0ABR8MMN0_9ACTN|nr:HAMP domain-containing sensor histidine kinase [Nocardioides hwasunensis]MBD3916825.1 HAMP domain-containing histidine kinase [Nocardioides hwasunensis]
MREWTRPESTLHILPPPGAGPEAALTMPWISQLARRDVTVLVDSFLLPEEAAQDRLELDRIDVRSLIGATFHSHGEMFGSLSVGSSTPGTWSEELVEDIRLLVAGLTSRMLFESSRRAMAEAIETGAEAQLAYQQFFGAVGHELRTPLAAVLGYTEVLLDDAEHGTPELVAKGMLRDGPVVVRACEQLLSVVDSLLGAGRTLSEDETRQDLNVAEAVADVVHWHRTPARTAGVRVVDEVDPDLTVWGHQAGVRQVLTSLLSNAITHHHHGGGTVHLSTRRLLGESGRPMVRIIVRDDGPGLTPEQMQHVFEPFVRYAERDTKGSGLGLSISRTIAERDGGAVRGESTPGSGSSFWLELPEDGSADRS